MIDFTNKPDFLAALGAAPKGAARAAILYAGNNRALIASHGVNALFYRGTSIDDAEVIVLRRRNRRTGLADGLGMLGGTTDRTEMDAAAFAALPREEQAALASKNDDIISDGPSDFGGGFRLTDDMDVIALRTLARESREELADLGLDSSAYNFDFSQAERVPMPGARDDNYPLNIWDGRGNVFAGSPLNNIMRLPDDVFDHLARDAAHAPPGGEALGLEVRSLRDILPCWGIKGGGVPAPEDGRDLERDFRYPHEWFNGWAVAAKLLHHDRTALIRLAADIQSGADHRIDFGDLARRAQVPLDTLDISLGVPPGTVRDMQTAMDNVRRFQPAAASLTPH